MKLKNLWNNYRYRLTPWLFFNFKTLAVPLKTQHELRIDDNDLVDGLVDLLANFKQPDSESIYRENKNRQKNFENCHYVNNKALFDKLNFELTIGPSKILGAGQGVFVSRGFVKRGQLVALYPGTVFSPSEPIFFNSIFNSFIFKCSDGSFVDGKRNGISGQLFKSCHCRDRIGSLLPSCDISWMFSQRNFVNPLNLGQIINNSSSLSEANVLYHELNLSVQNFPPKLFQFIPNVNYKGISYDLKIKVIPLIASKDIPEGDELLSTYFTIL